MMDRWRNRIAVVTGASAGIGAALVKDLVKAGVKVVALARREQRIQELRNSLPKDQQSLLYPIKCDVSNEDDVKKVFSWIDQHLGGTDILINNAGVVRTTELVKPNNTKEIRETVETNIMGVVYCTREAFNSMKRRNVDGHVVLINSIAGHRVPNFGNELPSFNIYPATKYAITAMTETLRQEFQKHNPKVKISSVSPGAVDTEIFPEEIEDKVRSIMPMLRAEDVSNAIMYVLGTPPNVQIHELTIKPQCEQC